MFTATTGEVPRIGAYPLTRAGPNVLLSPPFTIWMDWLLSPWVKLYHSGNCDIELEKLKSFVKVKVLLTKNFKPLKV